MCAAGLTSGIDRGVKPGHPPRPGLFDRPHDFRLSPPGRLLSGLGVPLLLSSVAVDSLFHLLLKFTREILTVHVGAGVLLYVRDVRPRPAFFSHHM